MTGTTGLANSEPLSYVTAGLVLVPIPLGQKGPTGVSATNWSARERCVDSPAVIMAFGPSNWGLAHAYSGTMALDVDNWTEAEAWLAQHDIDLRALYTNANAVAIDSGRSGHGKLIYRLPDGLDPLPSKKIKQGATDIVDFRCGTRNGQTVQDVLPPSIHPETGQPYQWRGDWRNIPEIPKVLLSLWQTLIATQQEPDRASSDVSGDVSLDEIQEALGVLNPDINYSDWIAVGMALHDQSPHYLDIWDQWSSTGEKYPGAQILERHWKSFSHTSGTRVTIGTLFHLATQAGWVHNKLSVRQMFGMKPRPELPRLVYVKALDRFMDTRDWLLHTRDQMNAMLPQGKKAPTYVQSFFTCGAQLGHNVFRTLTYRPNGDPVIDAELLNTWQPPRRIPKAGAVKPWLWLLERLFPEDEERLHILQWMAHTVQRPEVKINHSLLIVGPTPGQGKDTIFEPLQEALGRHNCRVIFADTLTSQWNDWIKEKKLIFVQEIMDFMDKGKISNYLKPMLASPPEMIEIRERYIGSYELPNIMQFVFFSNEEGAMRITQGDRRYFAVRTEAPPLGDVSQHIYDWYQSVGYAAVMDYLLEYDLNGFDPTAAPPMTGYKEELIELSRSQLDTLLIEVLGAHPERWQAFSIAKLRAELPEKHTDKQLSTSLRRLGFRHRRVRVGGRLLRVWLVKALDYATNDEVKEIIDPQP